MAIATLIDLLEGEGMEKKVQELEKRIEILEAELKEYKAQVKYLLGFKKGINEQKRLF